MTTPTTPAADAVSLPEPSAHMYPSDLERFETSETFAQAYSVAVGNPDERSVPVFTLSKLTEYATARESALVAERDALRAALDNKAAILDEIREVIGWEDASPVTTIKRLFAERDQLRAELNKCKVALVTSIRTSQ